MSISNSNESGVARLRFPGVQTVDALASGTTHLATVLGQVDAAQWSRPTPCEQWTLRDLVNHVVRVPRLYVLLLNGYEPQRDYGADAAGAFAAEIPRMVERIGGWDPLSEGEPVEVFTRSWDGLVTALSAPGVLGRSCWYPSGRRSGSQLADQALLDVVVHGWDVAQSIRCPHAPEPVLVELALAVAQSSFVDEASAFGAFPARTPAEGQDRSSLERLLTACGRTPGSG
jgi:uncharacterized protein (TIGR03086 family)